MPNPSVGFGPSEFYRAGMHDELAEMREKKQVCTMRKGKELMGIKKFPKLAELYKHLYNEDITNAHDAQYDTLYCYKCFDKMFPQEDDLFYFGDKEVRLTAEQKAVVYEATDKNMLVIACAGSGKSSTMLCRIKHLIDKGAPESSIIMMTFTRDAANDMRDKLHNIMGYKPDIKIGTIDSIAKYYTENHITSATAALKHVSEYGHYFLSYLQTCSPKFFERFQYLFVDEFQDINDTQYNIIQCFVKNGIRLFAVGDDAQNIYSFRGSSVEYILNFAGLFGNIAIHKLSRNFRCSEEIVNLANASIEKNVNQIPKVMTAAAAAGPVQISPEKNNYYSKNAVQFMVESLKDLRMACDETLNCLHGYDISILDQLIKSFIIQAVGFNKDYTPFAKSRDEQLLLWCEKKKITVFTAEDYTLFPMGSITTELQKPYEVYTPFYKKCLSKVNIIPQPPAAPKKPLFYKAKIPSAVKNIDTYYGSQINQAARGLPPR